MGSPMCVCPDCQSAMTEAEQVQSLKAELEKKRERIALLEICERRIQCDMDELGAVIMRLRLEIEQLKATKAA